MKLIGWEVTNAYIKLEIQLIVTIITTSKVKHINDEDRTIEHNHTVVSSITMTRYIKSHQSARAITGHISPLDTLLCLIFSMANTYLYVIRCSLWQAGLEPWRIVKLTASIVGSTSCSIPERICSIIVSETEARSRISSITEVVILNEWRQLMWPVILSVSTGTVPSGCIRRIFLIQSSYKCPCWLVRE